MFAESAVESSENSRLLTSDSDHTAVFVFDRDDGHRCKCGSARIVAWTWDLEQLTDEHVAEQ